MRTLLLAFAARTTTHRLAEQEICNGRANCRSELKIVLNERVSAGEPGRRSVVSNPTSALGTRHRRNALSERKQHHATAAAGSNVVLRYLPRRGNNA
jgi:hypothetical protein